MVLVQRWDGYGHPMKENERWMLDETAIQHFNRTKSNEAFLEGGQKKRTTRSKGEVEDSQKEGGQRKREWEPHTRLNQKAQRNHSPQGSLVKKSITGQPQQISN